MGGHRGAEALLSFGRDTEGLWALVADGWPGGMLSPGFGVSPGSKMESAGRRARGLVWLQVQAQDVSWLALTACPECCRRLLPER